MKFLADEGDAGQRLDRFASEHSGVTRSQVHKLIESGGVLVNGRAQKPNYKMRTGDEVGLTEPPAPTVSLTPEDIALDVLYHDEHLVVLNKPAGLVVHPAEGHPGGTLMNALRFKFGELNTVGAPLRPGVVHRLDMDTSGVMVVALRDEAYYGLVEQFGGREIKRSYTALVFGYLKTDEGMIDAKIGRSMTDRKKMSVRTRKGREALTRWSVLERYEKRATLLRVKLETGRTHQIRVHFASLGNPVLGDRTYGNKTSIRISGNERLAFPRQMLHAKVLSFIHPVTGKKMRFTSPLPGDIAGAIESLASALGATAPEPARGPRP